MPIDKLKVQAVHAEVRACFKGQPKSSNKGYHPLPPVEMAKPDAKKTVGFKPAHWKIVPGPTQRAQRQMDVNFVDKNLTALRHELQYRNVLLAGFKVLDQPMLIGNCSEMSMAAAYLVVLRKAGTPWIATVNDPGDHMFCIVTDGRTPTSGSVNEFALDFSGAWIIDPWANVCCEITEFRQEFVSKMASWKAKGKFVFGDFYTKMDPTSQEYLSEIFDSKLTYTKVHCVLPSGLPRALRDHKDGQSMPAWSARGKPFPSDG